MPRSRLSVRAARRDQELTRCVADRGQRPWQAAMRRSLVALWFASALAAQAPSTDVAVSEFPFLVGNMDGRIAEIVSNCQTYGIDTFYISAYRATGALTGDLWVTDSAGDWNAAWGPVRSG